MSDFDIDAADPSDDLKGKSPGQDDQAGGLRSVRPAAVCARPAEPQKQCSSNSFSTSVTDFTASDSSSATVPFTTYSLSAIEPQPIVSGCGGGI
jgi:hypothetical protein